MSRLDCSNIWPTKDSSCLFFTLRYSPLAPCCYTNQVQVTNGVLQSADCSTAPSWVLSVIINSLKTSLFLLTLSSLSPPHYLSIVLKLFLKPLICWRLHAPASFLGPLLRWNLTFFVLDCTSYLVSDKWINMNINVVCKTQLLSHT